MQRLRAFTLLEMCIVVSVIAILAAVAVPQMVNEVHKSRLPGAAEAVGSFAAEARSRAVADRRCTRVRLASAQELVMEKLNSFDCDQSAAGPFIDGSATQWLRLRSLKLDPGTTVAFTTSTPVASACPAAVLQEVRYRATGRICSRDTNVLNDDVVITVTAPRLPAPNTQRVLLDATGLICVLKRGQAPVGAGQNLSCPP